MNNPEKNDDADDYRLKNTFMLLTRTHGNRKAPHKEIWPKLATDLVLKLELKRPSVVSTVLK